MQRVQQYFPDVEIRANRLSRRLKLSFREGRGFLLTHPPRASERSVREFLEKQHEWMANIATRTTARPDKKSLRQYLEEHPELSLNGQTKTVRFLPTIGLVHESSHEVHIFPEITESQLSRKLQLLAKQPLTEFLMQLAYEHQLSVRSVHIRDQRSRWGSCSGRHNISLNWRLILMPHELQRHILLHELAHIPHPDHSERFWKCLEHWDPDTTIHRTLLKKMGKQWIELGRAD